MSEEMEEQSIGELRKTADRARDAIYRIETAQRRTENEKLVGKHFKYSNCYSCPEKPSDRWWLYAKVVRVDKDGYVKSVAFETDKYGKLSIESEMSRYHMDGWVPISAAEFSKAWRDAHAKISKLL